MYLIIHELVHVLVYMIPALVYKKVTKLQGFIALIIGLVVTVFLDLDHILDFWLYKGFSINVKEFFSGGYFSQSHKVHVFFHGWEYVVVCLLCYFLVKKPLVKHILAFIALGLTAHLLYDTIYYGFNWYSYFIVIRALHGFNADVLR
jgi:hypothetical protein